VTNNQLVKKTIQTSRQHLDIAIYASEEAQVRAERDIAKKLCSRFFKDDDGLPFRLTDGQADIFGAIVFKRHLRVQVETTTQYGKSETISMALLLRSQSKKEKWTVIAPDQTKADIIMGKAIQHIFDHEVFIAQLELEDLPKAEKLKHKRNQEKITWRNGGEIRTLTADARNRKRVKESLTGQGSRNIIEDESALIPDDLQAMVMRMLGGFKDSFLMKIGNPFYNNHFERTSKSKKYRHIHIDYHQAVAEGRYTMDFIEEMRQEPFFDILYEVKFPPKDEVVTGGYRRLFTDDLIENALITEEEYQAMLADDELAHTLDNDTRVLKGERRLGNDFAGGGSDRTSFVLRTPAVMKLLETNKTDDTMQHVVSVQKYRNQFEVGSSNIGNDYGGLGQGVSDRLYELDMYVNKVMFGGGAPEPKKYKNMRAYMYYQFKVWLENGGKIVDSPEWQELSVVYFKTDSSSRFQIEPKEDLKKRLRELNMTVTSPDVADAGALTFADNSEMIGDDDFEVV
jgi:hypothetical protein